MSNAIYPKFLETTLSGALTGLTLKCLAVNLTGGATQYSYSNTHQFVADVASGAIVARSNALTGITFTDGVLNASNLTPAFPTLSGQPFEMVIVYVDSGSDATSKLIVAFDTATGLPLIPAGTDVNIQWGAGIIKL